MIDPATYLTFVLVSAGIILLPGPNVLLIIATSLSHGLRAALLTMLGTSAAMVVQLLAAGMGTALLAAGLAEAFVWIKWLGALYLAWLGVQHLLALRRGQETVSGPRPAARAFWRGFLVSLTNPKTILFFGAFLPQFVSPSLPLTPQLTLLSVTFLVLAMLLDSAWAITANAAGRLARRPGVQRWRHGLSGVLFLGAGLGLALSRR